MQIEENVPLAPLTTIGIGGPARFFVRAGSIDDVQNALSWARGRQLEVFVLGGGSNLLIADDGFEGLVLQIGLRGMTLDSEDTHATVTVAAGEPWDDFVGLAARNGWAGVECLSGIPGSTGATPIQNVGAYGQEVAETIDHVEAFDRSTGHTQSFSNEECRFGYRASRFKNVERDRFVITSVTFRLERGGVATMRYPELQRAVAAAGIDPGDLVGVREAVIAIRRKKGMVIDATDPDTKSDGSFFMNPVMSSEEFARFSARAPAAPHFPAGQETKLSAAWLIEHAGFSRGFIHGNVGLSTKHTLAIVNRGGGTSREVIELVQMIQAAVRNRFGVELHPEPNFIGF